MRMASFRDGVTSLLYPGRAVCIACGALRVDHDRWPLCADCARALTPLAPPFCPVCGRPGWVMECPDCVTRPPDALDGRAAAFAYEKTARTLVRALKYHAVVPAAGALADGMLTVLPRGRYGALVPVPLYRTRERRRGFNQADALCRELSRETGLPVLKAVARERNTRTQTRLSREGRAENVRGAFRVCAPVTGLSLLLIDDVLTTGATALACAEALKEAGARRVFLLTAARAVEGRDA